MQKTKLILYYGSIVHSSLVCFWCKLILSSWVDNLPEVSPRYSTQDHKTSFTLSSYLDLTRVPLLSVEANAQRIAEDSDDEKHKLIQYNDEPPWHAS
jgi:hypothetical protein